MIKLMVFKILELLFPRNFVLTRKNSLNNEIFLTFDDGPHPENSARLLKILGKQNVKATFFSVGMLMEKVPQICERVPKEGHLLCNHSYYHKNYTSISLTEVEEDIILCNKKIEECGGEKARRLIRFPFGALNFKLFYLIKKLNLTYVGWTFDSMDSFYKDKNSLSDFISKADIQPGDILLFHEDYSSTVDAMENIINDLRRRGFTFALLDKVIKTGGR